MIYGELFLIGLLGSMHCIGMCGGFVALYALKKPEEGAAWPYHVLYNSGRITTYSILGGVLGQIGSFAGVEGARSTFPAFVLLATGGLMVAMGLNISGLVGSRVVFDDTGVSDLRLFRSALKKTLAFSRRWGVFAYGLLLGLLPCGLLYPVLIYASSSGGFFEGAATASAFGLGTVPAMVSVGFLMSHIGPHRKVFLYRVAGLLIVLFGIQSILRGLAYLGHVPHGPFW